MKNVTSILALAALPLAAQEAPPADTTAPVAAPAPKMVVSDHPEAATSIGKEDLKQIPDSVGRAGMVASAADGKILMTGGANFPDAKKGAKTAAERGAKKFYGDVVLYNMTDGSAATVGNLPYTVGYAAHTTTGTDTIVIAGGCNEGGHIATTIKATVQDGKLVTEELAPLPTSTAYSAYVQVGAKLYVFGGQEKADSTTALNKAYVLDTQNPAAGWTPLADMPDARMLAVAGSWNDKIYVAGGCSLAPNDKGEAQRTYLKSTLCYDTTAGTWSKVADMKETLVAPAGPMFAGKQGLYVLGGDPGNYYRKSIAGELREDEAHPGQSRKIYRYNPEADTWQKSGELSIGIATVPAVQMGDKIYAVSGETAPGVRTAYITEVQLTPYSDGQLAARDVAQGLAGFAPLTLWGGLIIAVFACLMAKKHGFKLKPVGKNVEDKPGKWAWIAVAVLWVVVMLNYFDRQLLAALRSSIVDAPNGGIEMTDSQFGLVTSFFLIVYAVLSPVGGYLADRFSRKFIILMSLVIWSVVTYMTGASTSYQELIFWRALMGVSEAFYIPAALALITDYHRGKTRSLATGLHMSGIYTGQMIAGCGAMMAGTPCQLGWSLTFEVFGFIGVAYALVVIFFLRDPEGDTAAAEAPATTTEAEEKPAAEKIDLKVALKGLFTGPAMAILMAMIACAGFANWFLMNWYPTLVEEMFKIPADIAAPQATFWINLAKYGAVLAAAVIADRWYLRNCNARAYVPGIAFCLAGPCVILAMVLGEGLGLAVVLALVATQGIAQGAMDATLMPVLRSQIDERFSATGYGLLNLTSVGAGAFVSWFGGFMKDQGTPLTATLSIAGILMVLCGLCCFMLPKKKREQLEA
ncbi:MAG: MFS transporter [Akkermansia sp.]|nr:MFS transporter [Akkermansia sp.]